MYSSMSNASRNRGKQRVVCDLVGALSRSRHLLLRIEDVHWAEPIVLSYLADLSQAVADLKALLIVTTRKAGGPLEATWQASTADAPLTTIDLGPPRSRRGEGHGEGAWGIGRRGRRNLHRTVRREPLFPGAVASKRRPNVRRRTSRLCSGYGPGAPGCLVVKRPGSRSSSFGLGTALLDGSSLRPGRSRRLRREQSGRECFGPAHR